MSANESALEVGDLAETSPGVFYSSRSFVIADLAIVGFLKDQAARTPSRRARLCAHPAPEAAQHDMLIVAHRSGYVGPHRHPGKTETFLVVEGRCDVFLFDADGEPLSLFPMGEAASGRAFFYRMPEMIYHALVVESDFLVFVESTRGPFDPGQLEAATWAPPFEEVDKGRAFLAETGRRLRNRATAN